MAGFSRAQVKFYEDSNFGKSDRRFYEDRLKSGRVYTAAGLVLDLAVVADGIGGESAGERAAEMTIQEVFDYAKRSAEKDIPLLLQTALEFANAMVYREAQSERHKLDMGSTAVVAAIHEGRLYIANIGDSRIYLVRGKNITQLTIDHTWGNEMVREGKLTPEEAGRHPHRDDLMHSIGYEPQVKVDLGLYLDPQIGESEGRNNQGLMLRRGDRVVLCSDGLTKKRRKAEGHFVEPVEIVRILSDAPPGEAAKMLVDKALERETDDNVSVIVVEMPGRPGVRMPKRARAAFVGILAVGLIALALLVPVLRRPPVAPTLPPGEISQNQARVAQVRKTSFEYLFPSDDLPRSAKDGEFIDFIPGTLLRTGSSRSGYAFIGLPGRAELFIGPDSEVTLLSSDQSGVKIQLDKGRAILNLRPDFPAGRRLTAFSPPGAETSLTGSKMCLSYVPESKDLRMDCVEDRCNYRSDTDKTVLAGYHVDFSETLVTDVNVGLQAEMCQFVPGVVPLSTATATVTPSITSTATLNSLQIQATATAKAGGGATFTPRPTSTSIQISKTPTSTPGNNLTATSIAATASALTHLPTGTLTGTLAVTPTGATPTGTLKPTNTPRPTNTIKPTITIKPTNTIKPTPTTKSTVTPKPPRPTNTPRPPRPTHTPKPGPNKTPGPTKNSSWNASTTVNNWGKTASYFSSHGRLDMDPKASARMPTPSFNLFTILGVILLPGVVVVRTIRLRS